MDEDEEIVDTRQDGGIQLESITNTVQNGVSESRIARQVIGARHGREDIRSLVRHILQHFDQHADRT